MEHSRTNIPRCEASIASGRSRQSAVPIIAARLRQLAEQADFAEIYPGPTAMVRVGRLYVTFTHVPSAGVYFGIETASERAFLMTGYLDPVPPGKFDNGRVHVMSWRRGWEAELFVPSVSRTPPLAVQPKVPATLH